MLKKNALPDHLKNEKVIGYSRESKGKLWVALFAASLYVLIPLGLQILSLVSAIKIPDPFGDPVYSLALINCAVVLMMIIIYCLTDYYVDRKIITNKRIIEIRKIGWFSKEITSVPRK